MAINMEKSIREIQGFAKLENDRVQTMYDNLKSNLDRSKIMAIIEVSNVESLIKLLKES